MQLATTSALCLAVLCTLAASAQAPDSVKAALSKSLTFHASFDRGPDADFARGDRSIY